MTPLYTTVAALRAQPGCGSLGDFEAAELIQRAEDLTDYLIGGWAIDDVSGRKIIEADTDAWRWARLSRFVTLLAARLYTNADAMDSAQWTSVRGPDFSFSGPRASGWEQRLGSELMMLLNGTGLRKLSGSMTGRRSYSSAADYWNDSDNWDDSW